MACHPGARPPGHDQDGEDADMVGDVRHNPGPGRGPERSGDIRTRLLERPAVPRTGEYVAETLARRADAGSPEEQGRLVRAAKTGDPRAREQLIERFLPLVVSLARSCRVEGLDFADLVQEGVVGLLRALERFDPDGGVPFPAYARWWVRYSDRTGQQAGEAALAARAPTTRRSASAVRPMSTPTGWPSTTYQLSLDGRWVPRTSPLRARFPRSSGAVEPGPNSAIGGGIRTRTASSVDGLP
jgi:Sigma-70 region 2